MPSKCKCHRNVRVQQLGDGVTERSGKLCQFCIEAAKKVEQDTFLEQQAFDKAKKIKDQIDEANKRPEPSVPLDSPDTEVRVPKPVNHKPAIIEQATKPEEVGPVTVTPKASVTKSKYPQPKTTKTRFDRNHIPPKDTQSPKMSKPRSLDDGTAFGEE